ncbi:MAG: hypothetical protein AAGB22_04955, partial [Bacteroidota bacterium]
PPCYIGFGLYTFFNNSNSVLNHRMYNQNIANNLPDSSFTWDFGDGSAPITQNNLGSQGHL